MVNMHFYNNWGCNSYCFC